MLTTIEGTYDNGRIDLAERPLGVQRAKVLVTFLYPAPAPAQTVDAEAVDAWADFLREGVALGGPPYPKRDELYDRGR